MEQKEIRNEAKRLAGLFSNKFDQQIVNGGQSVVEGVFNMLSEGNVGLEPYQFKIILTKLMSIISIPEVSKHLDNWELNHTGKSLLALSELMSDFESSNVMDYLTWVELDRFSGSINEERLRRIERHIAIRSEI